METFSLHNDRGDVYAFEIPSSYFLSSAGVARFFSRCPGVHVERVRRLFELGNGVHAIFTLDGDRYLVWEPYGDNSRYWIGLEGEARLPQSLDKLRAFVHSNWPGPVSALRARILSLFGVSFGAK
jgi:hypothetical protein